MSSAERVLNKIIGVIYTITIVYVTGLLLIANFVDYSEFHKRHFVAPNVILFAVGIILMILAGRAVYKSNFSFKSKFTLPLIILIFTVVMAICSLYRTGWDAGTVVSDTLNYAFGNDTELGYYSENPNNRLIFVILSSIFRVSIAIGITNRTVLYGIVVVIQCILFWLTGLIVRDIIYRITEDKKTATFGYLLCSIFVTMSPWVVVAYTDCFGLIFPILVLWLFMIMPDDTTGKKIVKWLVLLTVALLGYQIKTTAFVAYIAELCALFVSSFSEKKRAQMLLDLAIFVLNVIFLVPLFIKCEDFRFSTTMFELYTDSKCDREQELTPYHYFMMGLNEEYDGTFNFDDDTFSHYIQSYDERISQEKKQIKIRLKSLGPWGVVKLYSKKLIIDYNDGSYGYGLAGDEFVDDPLLEDAPWNIWARFFTLPTHKGHPVYLNLMQIIWLGMIPFMLFFKLKDKTNVSLALCLVGITMFVLIFESQQRYLFLYGPVYVIVAVIGLHNRLKATYKS